MNQPAYPIPPTDQPPLDQRPLPHNLDAEKALLGAILVNNKAYRAVEEILSPEDFCVEQHAKVFSACRTLIERGRVADIIALKQHFDSDSSLSEIGGAVYLADLAASAVTLVNAREYGRIIQDLSVRRQGIDALAEGIHRLQSDMVDSQAADIIADIDKSMGEIESQIHGAGMSMDDVFGATENMIEQARLHPGKIQGVTTGISDLDKILLGLRDQDMIIIAGRPSMGKTALGGNIAKRSAESLAAGRDGGAACLFFSLEMSAAAIMMRLVAEAADFPFSYLQGGQRHRPDTENPRIAAALAHLRSLPLEIDDRGGLSVAQIRARVKEFKRKHKGVRVLVIIDQLGHIRIPPSHRSTNDDIGGVTKGLKAIAKECDLPLVVLHQLSRKVEERQDKRPMLADLRDSGNIEQDADVVIFPFREIYYLERAEPKQREDEPQDKFQSRLTAWECRCEEVKHTAELIVAKNRQGQVTTIKTVCRMSVMRFGDQDYQHPQGGH